MSSSSLTLLFATQVFTMLAALLVALHPNILYATISLLFTFMGVAVMFIFAGADFMAGAQIVIYVGGVTILVLFAIMLTQWMYQMKLRDNIRKMIVPTVVIVAGLSPFIYRALKELIGSLTQVPSTENLTAFAATPKTFEMGSALLNAYLLPFEGITVLLLGALVGAAWLARPK